MVRIFKKPLINFLVICLFIISFNFIPLKKVVEISPVKNNSIVYRTLDSFSPLEVKAFGLDTILSIALDSAGAIVLAPEAAAVLSVVCAAGVVFASGYAAYQFANYLCDVLQNNGAFSSDGSLTMDSSTIDTIDNSIKNDLPKTGQSATVNTVGTTQTGDMSIPTKATVNMTSVSSSGSLMFSDMVFYTDYIPATALYLTVSHKEDTTNTVLPNTNFGIGLSYAGNYRISLGLCNRSTTETYDYIELALKQADGSWKVVQQGKYSGSNLYVYPGRAYEETLINSSVPLHQEYSQACTIPYTGTEGQAYSKDNLPKVGSVVTPAKSPTIPVSGSIGKSVGDTVGSVSAPTDTPGTGTGTINIPILSDILGALQGLWDWLKGILQSILNAIMSIPGVITSAIDSLKLDWSLPNTAYIDFAPLEVDVSSKFPFSIPFDLINMFKGFSATPKAPKWEATFPNVAGLGEQKLTIDWDKTELNKIATITRYFLLIAFVIGLILITKELI